MSRLLYPFSHAHQSAQFDLTRAPVRPGEGRPSVLVLSVIRTHLGANCAGFSGCAAAGVSDIAGRPPPRRLDNLRPKAAWLADLQLPLSPGLGWAGPVN